jgi:hypothetical protein
MATTDGKLAAEAVRVLARSGVLMAVLHREDELAAGSVTSDVDLVVDRPLAVVVEKAGPGWRHLGLRPLIVWPYDVGGTGTIFLSTSDASDGIQIDVLHDPAGRGQYGARSGVLLDRTEDGDAFSRVADTYADAYLLAKRLRKGELGAAADIVARSGLALRSVAAEVLRKDVANLVLSFVDGSDPGRFPRRAADPVRLARRILSPIGGWIDVGDEALAHELSARFGRFLSLSTVAVGSSPSWMISVASIRWRAGIAFTVGRQRMLGLAQPDARVSGTVDAASAKVVESLSARHVF